MGTLLKTQFKPKLPQFLSFPVGVQALSAHLAGIPQFDALELAFSTSPNRSKTMFRHLVEADETHLVLSARFDRWDKRRSLGDDPWIQEYLQGKWSLWIYPVRRQRGSQAKEALLNDALPQVARWFSTARVPSWYWGRKRCNVMFAPADGGVRVDEVIEAS